MSAQVKITALNTAAETGVNFINGYANDTIVAITNVRVVNIATGQVVENSNGSVNDPNIAISFASGVATVTGVLAGYRIEYATTTDHDRVLVENGAALTAKGNDHADFDIGGFKLVRASTGTAEIGSKIFFEDDGPSLGTTGAEPTLTVDETVLATDAAASFAGNFSAAFGADGAGTLDYALGVAAGASGLVDTATNEAVNLSLVGGVVQGRTATTNALVFTVSVAANGSVTLDQLRAVVHADTGNPDDSTGLAADNLVTLTATATDKDGDSAQAVLDIGHNLFFKDDGPSLGTTGAEPTLTVDETVLATDAAASFAGNFSAAFGADGAGTLDYVLGVAAGDSGLVDTATNEAVNLSLVGGVVQGRTATTNALVFTVSVAANGSVTLDQLRAVVHADTGNPDDSTGLAADNLVTLTATATDKDGDSAQATLDIGHNLFFKDDGPSLGTTGAEPTLTVDETVLATDAAASFAGNFSAAFGADGAGTLDYVLGVAAGDSGLVDTATNEAVNLSLVGGVVQGRTATTNALVFTVSVAANGSVTLDQLRAVVHADTGNPDDSTGLAADNLVTLTATATDKDGDSAQATLDIGHNLFFKDDGPSLGTTGAEPTLTVDETVLATDAAASFAGNFSAAFGADGAGTLDYALGVAAGASGLVDTATNEAVNLSLVGGVVQGRTATTNALVFTVSVAANGSVTLDQLRAVVHADTGNPDDSTGLAADNLVTLTATATDKDGDSAQATLDIGHNLFFKDDGPSVSTNLVVRLDDDALSGGNAGGTGDDIDTANASGTLGHSFGADNAGAIAYLTTGAPADFSYEAGAGNSLLVKQGTRTVLTLSLDSSTGAYTVTQNAPILHAAGLDENNQAFTINYQVTDGDGDSASGTLSIDVDDDTPAIRQKSDLVYANASNPSPGGTGVFDYSMGADSRLAFSASNSDFAAITLTGTVGSAAISSPTVTWFSEDANTAVFNIQFSYQPDPASATTAAAAGTLTFDKMHDSYTVALSQPIAGFNTLTTGQALGFTGYTAGSNAIDQTQPDVSVAQLSTNFFVQFTGISEPGGGTGANNLQAAGGDAGTNFVNGELFTQAATWVSVSNTANGVAGDTIQKGEVLDLDFFNTNPTGFTGLTPTTQANGVFLKFDGIGSEDLVLVLKLVDPDDQSRTTKAIIIDNSDIIKFGGTLPAGYNLVLDNNDGAVFIENNDFNTGAQNYLIEGAQLLVSTEGVTGTAINLNPLTGASGGSTTFQEFQGTPGTANPEAATTDNDVIKISDIGFVTANSATLNANLNFQVAVVDADGDATGSQTLGVNIVGGANLSPTSAADTFAFAGADKDGLLAAVMYNVTSGFASGTDKLDFSTAGSVTSYAENLLAAATLSAFVTAADTALNGTVQYYFGVVGSDGYLATDADGDGITSIVKLAGVTDMAFSDII